MSPEKVIRCLWCKQPIIKGLTTDFNDPHHPDCYEYGRHLNDYPDEHGNILNVGWTPTRDYVDTPETRKAMREQFHAQTNPKDD